MWSLSAPSNCHVAVCGASASLPPPLSCMTQALRLSPTTCSPPIGLYISSSLPMCNPGEEHICAPKHPSPSSHFLRGWYFMNLLSLGLSTSLALDKLGNVPGHLYVPILASLQFTCVHAHSCPCAPHMEGFCFLAQKTPYSIDKVARQLLIPQKSKVLGLFTCVRYPVWPVTILSRFHSSGRRKGTQHLGNQRGLP